MCACMPLAMLHVVAACAYLHVTCRSHLLTRAYSPRHVPLHPPSILVVWVYTLTTMVKPRINPISDKRGYRVHKGRGYLGFFSSKKKAEDFVRNLTAPDTPQRQQVESKPYKYVRSMTRKRKKVYYGVKWVRAQGKREWSKTYFPRFDSPHKAAAAVAKYMKTTAGNIRVNKSQRESPAQSLERVAFLSKVFRGWIPADLANCENSYTAGCSSEASWASSEVGKLLLTLLVCLMTQGLGHVV